METWIIVGAVVVAAAPRIPGLRQTAKAAVKGGMRVAEHGRDAATTAGEHWADLVAEAKAPAQDNGANGSVSDVPGEVKVPVTNEGEAAG